MLLRRSCGEDNSRVEDVVSPIYEPAFEVRFPYAVAGARDNVVSRDDRMRDRNLRLRPALFQNVSGVIFGMAAVMAAQLLANQLAPGVFADRYRLPPFKRKAIIACNSASSIRARPALPAKPKFKVRFGASSFKSPSFLASFSRAGSFGCSFIFV